MNDQTINRKLALAIGWRFQRAVFSLAGRDYILTVASEPDGPFHNFDFMVWRVAGPIAQRYDCFPMRTPDGKWFALVKDGRTSDCTDTPQEAIALAVIAAHEAGVLK